MKNSVKRLGIIAIIAIIGLSMAGCDNEPKPAHVHQWGEWDVTPATCITTGSQTRICALDATHTETETIPIDLVDGHDWGEWEGTVTCTTAGTGTRTCSRSPTTHIETDNNLQPLGHNYQDWTTTTPSTCTTAGEETGACTRDQVTTTRAKAINPNAHNWNNNYTVTTPATCSATGIETDTCSLNTLHTRTQTVAIVPNAHNYNYTQTTAPTCSARGIDTGTCTYNNQHTTTREGAAINPNAHDYQWVETTAPTFITEGEETRICSHNATHTDGARAIDPRHITTTQEWSDALTQLNGKTGSYTLTIGGNFAVSGTTAETFGTTASYSSPLTVTLQGNGRLYLTSRGNMLRIAGYQTLIIDSEDLFLEGLTNDKNGATQDNDVSTLHIGYGGTLVLRNGNIIGNTASGYTLSGSGVYVDGTFTMTGGTINSNTNNNINSSGGGGGVYVFTYGQFNLEGGTISSNTSSNSGGGVHVRGIFNMSGGSISDNTGPTDNVGGGVWITGDTGKFTMSGGTISGNTSAAGAGVSVYYYANFTMSGGVISGNTATYPGWYGGGGVFIGNDATFSKSGNSIIYGNDAPNAADRNTTNGGNTCGHAVLYDGESSYYRDTTIGENNDISTADSLPTASGQTLNGWTRQ